MCGVWVGQREGWEEEGEGGIDNDGVGVAPYLLRCVNPRLSEIHSETDGPNSREIVVGAFVAWCPP